MLIKQPKAFVSRHLLNSVWSISQFHDFDAKEELTSNNTGMVVGVRVEKRTTKGLGQMTSSSRQKKNTYTRVKSTHVSIPEQGNQ